MVAVIAVNQNAVFEQTYKDNDFGVFNVTKSSNCVVRASFLKFLTNLNVIWQKLTRFCSLLHVHPVDIPHSL